MPINEYGAEVINGFVVVGSRWNELRTARVIIALRMDQGEFVTATAGKVGVTEWNNGHYFRTDSTMEMAMRRAKDDYSHRPIPPITQNDVNEWFAGWLDAGYPYMGSAEHNWHRLESDGRIRSIWANDAGEFIPTNDDPENEVESGDVIQTVEEWAESFHSWQFDY